MKLKRYDDFVNEEINLRKDVIAPVALAAGTMLSPNAAANTPPQPGPGTEVDSTQIEESEAHALIPFVLGLQKEKPGIFSDAPMRDGQRLPQGSFESLSYLQHKLEEHQTENGVELNMDLLSTHSKSLPFNINYFYARGLDNLEGPYLVRIINVNYNKAITLGGHEIMFNFTKVQDVNTYGVKVNF